MGWEELEDRTLWDITTNGSPFELVSVSVVCSILAFLYAVAKIYYRIKFRIRR